MADPQIRRPWSRSNRPIPRTIIQPLQAFLATSTASALVLLGAVVVALVWANVGGSYARLWQTPLVLRIGGTAIGTDLRWWIDQGAMTLFFLLVGIEIKRELVTGELREPRAAALPAVAALGGMLVPALVFLLVVRGGPAQRGWGVPMATDVALALGALALAARHAPRSLRPLLLTLAIVDDIGAIVVIAVFYASGGSGVWLLAAVAMLAVIVSLQKLHVRATAVYVVAGVAVWYLTYRSGIHPTIAGVALGLLTPAVPFQRPAAVSAEAKRTAEQTVDDPEPPDADSQWWLRLSWLSRESVSPLARIEHAVLPWSSFLIVPLFGLANAGVALHLATLRGALTGRLGVAIVLGLVVGKPVGVLLAGRLAASARIGVLPEGVAWGDVLGMGATAGIGFTMALFVAGLAFPAQPALLADAKVAILVASSVAGLAGNLVLRAFPSPAEREPG